MKLLQGRSRSVLAAYQCTFWGNHKSSFT